MHLGVLVLGGSQERHSDLWQVVCHLCDTSSWLPLWWWSQSRLPLWRWSQSSVRLTKYWILPPSNSWGTAVGVSPQNPLEQPAKLWWFQSLQNLQNLDDFNHYKATKAWLTLSDGLTHHLSGLSSPRQVLALLSVRCSFPPLPWPLSCNLFRHLSLPFCQGL